MKFAVFDGRDKRQVYVNPNLVTYIREVGDRSCLICFGPEHSVEVTIQAALAAEDIQRVASLK